MTHRNGGRKPLLNRADCDIILLDERPIKEVARTHGLSITTVMKVKGLGRFAMSPYVPLDDYVRQPKPPIEPSNGMVPSYPQLPPGRKFSSGREPLTTQEKYEIAYDPRTSRKVGEQYGVSSATVTRIRKQFGTEHLRRGKWNDIQRIFDDKRDPAVIAEVWQVTLEVIKHIKAGWDDET